MPYRALIIFILLLFVQHAIAAAGSYDYNDNCRQAYQQFMSLHTQEGRHFILEEKKVNPRNLMAEYIADYDDCIQLLMNCDQAEYDRSRSNFEDRLKALETGDKTSPWYRFCIAGLYIHRAIINVRFGEQYKAALNFRKSFSLLEENTRLFPQFEYNRVFLGLEQAVVGSLPGSYKWLASVLGMSGSVRKGTDQLTTFVNTHTNLQPIYAESVLYYVFARFYLLSEQKETWEFLNGPRFSTNNDLLNTFAKVNIALDYRQANAASEILSAAAANPEYNKYPIFDYQIGAAMLTRLDSGCTFYFGRYLEKNKSDIYIKDTWQKMAFAWYTNNNMPKANYCIAQARTKGTARLDADKQAGRFAETEVWPLPKLLQARLLIDGGYSDRALFVLQSVDSSSLKRTAEKAEYYYRLGRAYQSKADNNEGKQFFVQAINNYTSTINAGKESHDQFAARAALQMGKMYEYIGMSAEAMMKYKECLAMPSHDFQNSIDQQAKAGINRVEGK